jgi:hypothetical protein
MPWREPLVHFLILAGLLFAFEHFWSARQKERIVVDRQTADFLIQQREELELRQLAPDERREIIESWIEDEILYREAYKRGLDKDARTRRNLILKMRGLALSDLRDPTEAELRAYFEANRERFRRAPTIVIDQVYYRDEASIPEGLLGALRDGLDHKDLGDFLASVSPSGARYSARELAGFHFVRLVARLPEQDASYEDVASYLAQDWAMAQARRAIEEEVERVRDDYQIVFEADGVLP